MYSEISIRSMMKTYPDEFFWSKNLFILDRKLVLHFQMSKEVPNFGRAAFFR